MKKRKLLSIILMIAMIGTLLLASCGSGGTEEAEAGETITITDMAGREVTFTKNPQKIFAEGVVSEPWLTALAPDRMIGWAAEKSDEALQYYPESTRDLPMVGGWVGEQEGNAEAIIELGPDLILSCGFNMQDEEYKNMFAQNADELSAKLDIPVVVLDLDLENIPQSMRNLGEWIGEEDRANMLADYLQGELDKVQAVVDKVPEDERPTYYYAEDISGLMTEPADTPMGKCHTGPEDYCGMQNVAKIGDTTGYSYEEVSLEQVIQWNPDTIFVFEETALDTIRNDDSWKVIDAVKNDKIFFCNNIPDNWFDRSPNPFCVLGTVYTCAMVYPDVVDFDLNEEIKGYFKTMYQVDLTDAQVEALFK